VRCRERAGNNIKSDVEDGFMKLAGHHSDDRRCQVKPVLIRIIDESAPRAKRDP